MDLRCRILEKTMLEGILDEYDIIPSTDDLYLLRELPRPRCDTYEVSYAKLFTEAIKKITSNEHFVKRDFLNHDLLLCESFCLLWQNAAARGSSWKHLERSEELNQGICGAMLLDLYAANKITFLEDRRHSSPRTNATSIYIEVLDNEPTCTFIDSTLFNKLTKQPHHSRKNLQDLLLAAKTLGYAKLTLKNLRSRGIIGNSESSRLFATTSRRQSTLNFGPIHTLERRIKFIALKEQRPDSYMLSLLTMSLIGTDCFCFVDKILETQFTKREYKVAKENLTVVVRTQATSLKSPKFVRKKFSRDLYADRNQLQLR